MRLPGIARFTRVPVILSNEWSTDAQIFYALEAIAEMDRLRRQLFEAIHREGASRLRGRAYTQWVANWLSKQGVDMKKYEAAFASDAVREKVAWAQNMTASNKIEAVPALGVQGRHIVSPLVGDAQAILNAANKLIDEERKEISD